MNFMTLTRLSLERLIEKFESKDGLIREEQLTLNQAKFELSIIDKLEVELSCMFGTEDEINKRIKDAKLFLTTQDKYQSYLKSISFTTKVRDAYNNTFYPEDINPNLTNND